MAVKLRLTRVGSKKNPVYRIVAADSRSPRDGKFLEIVGRYNPQTDPSTIELDEERIKDWLSKGAQPSSTVREAAEGQGCRARLSSSSTWPAASSTSRTRSGSRSSSARATLVIELYVAKDDVGKVIGRQGRIARALRTVVRASAARRSGRTLLEIVE